MIIDDIAAPPAGHQLGIAAADRPHNRGFAHRARDEDLVGLRGVFAELRGGVDLLSENIDVADAKDAPVADAHAKLERLLRRPALAVVLTHALHLDGGA